MSVATLTDIARSEKVVSGGVWDYVSASRLNLWLKCPLAFRIRYIDGIRSPTTPALFVGKQTHDALEVHYRNLQLGNVLSTNDVVGHVFESWEDAIEQEGVKFDNVNAACASKQQTANLVRAYLDHVADDPVKPLAVETSLKYELIDPATGEDLGIPLLGVVDLVHDQGQGPVVCDFKTASRSSASRNR